MIPSSVFRELAEDWLSSFEVREEGFRLLSAATEMPADSWRKRLSEATYTTRKGSVGAHGWYAKTTLTEEEVDEFLTAAGLTHLWHTDLSEYQPPATAEDEDFHSTCVDCGTWIDWSEAGAGVTVEIGQVVNVRRQYRWFSLCPVCTSTRFPLPEKPDATGLYSDGRFIDYSVNKDLWGTPGALNKTEQNKLHSISISNDGERAYVAGTTSGFYVLNTEAIAHHTDADLSAGKAGCNLRTTIVATEAGIDASKLPGLANDCDHCLIGR